MKNDEIKKLRAAYGMTQSAFSSALGVSCQTVYYWESGRLNPSSHQKIVLHRLARMSKNRRGFLRAFDAMDKSQFMRPCPEDSDVLGSTDLRSCGLGRLLLALFRVEEDFGLDSLSGIMFKLSEDKKKVSFNESLIRPLEDGTQFRLAFIDKKKAVRIKKMLEKAAAQLKIAISGMSK